MPNTYTNDTINAVNMLEESEDNVIAANNTGAQQEEVIPEKSPNTYVERVVVLVGIVK